MLRRSPVGHCATTVRKKTQERRTPVEVFRTTWGVPGAEAGFADAGAVREYLRRALRVQQSDTSGETKVFDGVEFCAGVFFPFAGREAAAATALREVDAKAIVQVHTCGYPVPPAFASSASAPTPVWKAHADSLRIQAESMVSQLDVGGAVIACFNCHGAKDSFPREDALRFLEEACVIEKDLGVPVCHETHRQRLFHNPLVLQSLRSDLPSAVKLNVDVAHFVVAMERVLSAEADAEFWPEVLEEVLVRRAALMHCRVGLPQQAQLQNAAPFLSDYAERLGLPCATPLTKRDRQMVDADADARLAVESHMAWWKAIGDGMRKRGLPVRVVPEYGPPPYQTVGNASTLEETCVVAGNVLREAL